MKIKIEKGVPIPSRGGEISTALRRMEKGDSFLIEKKKRGVVGIIAGRAGIGILTRFEANGIIRVWRTT